MSFLNTLKSMVGKGAPKVEVKLLNPRAAIQEVVKGTAQITGGEYQVKISKLILSILTVEEVAGKDKPKDSTNKVGSMTYNDYQLEPGEIITVPFQVIIPRGNLITSTAVKHYVQITLDITGQDSFGVCEVTIV
jgi:sporulation-control protein spo0M